MILAGDAASSALRYDMLTPADLEAVFGLHMTATRAVERPDLIKPETREFFERLLAGEGRLVGAWQDRTLAGYGVLQLILPQSEDARACFGLGGSDVLVKLAGASVLPSQWGRGIHNVLIEKRLGEADRLGLRHLYSTSAPGNARSWENLLDAGFVVRAVVEKYGGHDRYLLYRDLSASPARIDEGVWCAVEDVGRQRELLSSGLVGLAWRSAAAGEREIFFGKLPP